jgi:transcriptional regulator with XRE-family HTH domain
MDETEAIMKKVRTAFEASGITLDELGKRMGAESKTARMSAWQFLNKTTDPRLSMLLRFCAAVNLSLLDLLPGKKKRKQ